MTDVQQRETEAVRMSHVMESVKWRLFIERNRPSDQLADIIKVVETPKLTGTGVKNCPQLS